jgi:dipeptidyl aminopeptidase/acylaminoacyl peptidase
MAARLDPGSRRLATAPVALFDGLSIDWFSGAAHFALAPGGTLAYVPGGQEVPARTLAVVDAEGREQPLPFAAQPFMNLAGAPDGRRLALTVHQGRGSDLWLGDVARGTLERLTFEGHNIEPVFAPDGRHVAFATSRRGPYNLARLELGASAAPEILRASDQHQYPTSLSPDGALLIYGELHPESGDDLWLLPLSDEPPPGGSGAPPEGSRVMSPRELLRTRFDEREGRFSPDGRLFAYTSNESGRDEVYVRPYPAKDPKLQISAAGGEDPRFSPDGRRLYYRGAPADGRPRRLHVVALAPTEAGAAVEAGAARALFEVDDVETYTPLPDGRLVLIRGPKQRVATSLNLLPGWGLELERLAP